MTDLTFIEEDGGYSAYLKVTGTLTLHIEHAQGVVSPVYLALRANDSGRYAPAFSTNELVSSTFQIGDGSTEFCVRITTTKLPSIGKYSGNNVTSSAVAL